jgi:phage shock protein PspC (stress-responsive transcriptional regulator)
VKRLYRSQTDKKLAGIFGGLGEIYSVDPTLLRLVAVFLALCTGIVPFVVAYVVGWIIVPKASAAIQQPMTAEPKPTR